MGKARSQDSHPGRGIFGHKFEPSLRFAVLQEPVSPLLDGAPGVSRLSVADLSLFRVFPAVSAQCMAHTRAL